MTLRAGLGLALGVCWALPTQLAAQDIVVPYERNYPPFSDTTPAGAHEGYNIAVARALAEVAGLDIRFEPVGFFEISDGDWPPEWGFAVASVSYLATRDGLYSYLGEYLYDEIVIVGREPESGDLSGPVAGSRIGVCRTCAYRAFLEGSFRQTDGDAPPAPPFPGIEIDNSHTSETAMIDHLIFSETPQLDFVVVSRFFAEFLFIRSGYPIEIVNEPLYFDPLWVIASNDRPELHAPLRDALAQLKSDGTLSDLSQQYLGDDFTSLPQ